MTAKRLNSPVKMQRDLLWTNPNPTLEFAAQDVSVTYDDYDEYWIYTKPYRTYDNGQSYLTVIRCGYTNHDISWIYFDAADAYIWSRKAVSRITYIAFDDSYTKSLKNTSAPTKENARNVPYQIYGVKYS